MTRSAAREIAIQLGFSVTGTGLAPEEAVEAFFEPEHYASLAAEGELYAERPSKRDMDFIRRSVSGVAEHKDELDGLIGKYAKGWRHVRAALHA